MKLKKSLGQHFLIDENICNKIANETLLLKPQNLLEIGAGAGAITKYLYNNKEINFKAFEIDLQKIEYLEKTFVNLKPKLFHQDVLTSKAPFNDNFSVVGNFPYNISSQILFKFIEWKDNLDNAIGMFQKEVADRIIAIPNNKNYGILSILIQTYFDASLLFYIEPNSFNPPPKVRSAMVLLKKKKEFLEIENFELYKLIIKTAFQQRRKQLINSLSPIFPKHILKEDFFKKRPENLTKEDFFKLYKLKLNNI